MVGKSKALYQWKNPNTILVQENVTFNPTMGPFKHFIPLNTRRD